MGTPSSVATAAPVACMLSPVDGAYGYFTCTAGTLALTIKPVVESVQFNDALCLVWDITSYPAKVPVAFTTATLTDVSFPVEAGKRYHVFLPCTFQPSPYTAKAELRETGCGQLIYTLDVITSSPGMYVTVAAAPVVPSAPAAAVTA